MGQIIKGAAILEYPEPTWLMDGLIPDDSVGLIYGQPEAGKSWAAMHLALQLAMDGHPVLYIAAERARLLIDRTRMWATHHGMPHPPDTFAVLAGRPQLCSRDGWTELSDAVSSEQPRMVVLDTFAQMTDGIRENDGSDMGRAIAALTAIKDQQTRQGHSGTVLVVHHEGKDGSRGPRGHSSLFGAADYQIQVTRRQQIVTLQWDKLSAADHHPRRSYRLDGGIFHDLGEGSGAVSGRAVQVWEWIRSNGGQASTGELVDGLGWDAKTVRLACQTHPLISANGEAGKRARWIAAPEQEDNSRG